MKVNEENDCDKKEWTYARGSNIPNTLTLKELWEKSHNTQSAEDKMLEAGLHFKDCSDSPRHRENVHSVSYVTPEEWNNV